MIETGEAYGIKESPYASAALLYIVTTVNLGKALYGSAEEEGKGLKLDACKEFIRAWPGGTGSFKLGANYGKSSSFSLPSLISTKEEIVGMEKIQNERGSGE